MKFKQASNAHLKSTSDIIYVIAIFIIILIGFSLFFQFNKLKRANTMVNHTYEVIFTAKDSIYLFNYFEARQRGYLVQKNVDINKLSIDSINNINKYVTKLLFLTQDNMSQNKLANEYRSLLKERFDIIKTVVALRDENKFGTPEGMMLFQKGELLSRQLNKLMQYFLNNEYILLAARNKSVERDSKFVNTLFIVGETLSLMFLIFALYLSRLDAHKRKEIEKNKNDISSQLQSLIYGAKDMIAALDNDFNYIILNDAYKKEFRALFGVSIKKGDNLEVLFKDQPEVQSQLIDVWKKSMSAEKETNILSFSKSNRINTYEIISSQIKNNEDKVKGAVQIIRNITDRIKKEEEIKLAYDKLTEATNQLKDKNDKITLILEMSDILLTSQTLNELREIVSIYAAKILPHTQGILYLMHPSHDMLEASSRWGNAVNNSVDTYSKEDCWSLRLAHIHMGTLTADSLTCTHIKEKQNPGIAYLCVPLRAQLDILGVLYIEYTSNNKKNELDINRKIIINAFAEVIALALSNIRLRENLQYQSISDPLTGLYNRRYLNEFLSKAIFQSERTSQPLGILMMDLDHFKRINDIYGHEGGDILLKAFSNLIAASIRIGDIACRYGGEEFIIMLYNSDETVCIERAETIRKDVDNLNIKYGTQNISKVTVSIGIATFPEDSKNMKDLIMLADEALYMAKKTGRNKIVCASNLKKNDNS